MPVLIKAYVIANVSQDTMHRLKVLLENFTFRAMVRGGRASVESRLNRLLINATNEESVLQNIMSFIDSMRHDYWNDRQFMDALNNGYIYNRTKACSYLLWRYEETLWAKGYKANLFNIEKESIEHIAPQHPREGECLANGYGAYNDADTPANGIESGEWLSSIGNLMLVSTRHNSSLGNSRKIHAQAACYRWRLATPSGVCIRLCIVLPDVSCLSLNNPLSDKKVSRPHIVPAPVSCT